MDVLHNFFVVCHSLSLGTKQPSSTNKELHDPGVDSIKLFPGANAVRISLSVDDKSQDGRNVKVVSKKNAS